ncbi:hypothetical protein CBR_g26264, partial [Chara braunii]
CLSAFAPLLTHLDIAECCGVTRGGICAVLENCHYLTSINLEGCLLRPEESVHVLRSLVRNCPDLRALNLANCALEEEAIALLASEGGAALPQLASLVLNLVDPLGISVIEDLGRSLNLTELVVGWNEWFGNEEAVVVADTCPQLTALDISWTSVSDPGVLAITSGCPKLQRLVATCTKITDDAVEKIVENCREMKQLCLKRCLTTDRSLGVIARSGCSNLTGLWLYGVYETSCVPSMLTLADLHQLFSRCPRLCELTLRLFDLSASSESRAGGGGGGAAAMDVDCPSRNRTWARWTTATGEREVAGSGGQSSCTATYRSAPLFRSLAMLHQSLRGVSLVADPNWVFSDLRAEMFHFLRACPKLVRFGVKNYRGMTDQLCGEMGAACPTLEHVTFAGCTSLTVEGLKLLVTNCKRLKSIDISKCDSVQGDVGSILQRKLPNRRVVMINPTIEAVCKASRRAGLRKAWRRKSALQLATQKTGKAAPRTGRRPARLGTTMWRRSLTAGEPTVDSPILLSTSNPPQSDGGNAEKRGLEEQRDRFRLRRSWRGTVLRPLLVV